MNNRDNQRGFTIIELLIASTIFSIVLLICMTALLQITKNYQKGVSTTRTQEVARSLMTTISESIQFSRGDVVPNLTNAVAGTSGFCIDHHRFTYITDPNHFYNGSPSDHGLVMDDIGASGSGKYCNAVDGKPLNFGEPLPSSSKELLQPRMRIVSINITPLSNKLYRVTIQLGLGENDILAGGNCIGGTGREYCASTTLTNIVQKRV